MDQQNHVISLIAVFLALGIGILIGASMVDNALVFNQIAVIESLRNEIINYKNEINSHFSQLNRLQEELSYWESLEEKYFEPIILKNSLENVVLKVIVQDELPEELRNFLELSGCWYKVFLFNKDILGYSELLEKINFKENEECAAAESLQEKGLLNIKTNYDVLLFAPENQSQGEDVIIAAGLLDPLLEERVKKAGENGGYIRVFLTEFDNEVLNAANPTVFSLDLNKFLGRLTFLELVREQSSSKL